MKGDGFILSLFFKINDSSCEMEYFEWMDEGDLDGVVEQELLDNLKLILEK